MGSIIRTISEVGHANSQHNNDGTDGQRLPTTATIIDEKQQQRQHVSHITGGNSQGGVELEQEQEGRFIGVVLCKCFVIIRPKYRKARASISLSDRSECRHQVGGQVSGRIIVVFNVISEQGAGLDADAICTRGRRRESPSHINRQQ